MNRFDDITDMLLQGLFLQLNIFSDEKDMFSSEKVFSFGKDIGYLSLGDRDTRQSLSNQTVFPILWACIHCKTEADSSIVWFVCSSSQIFLFYLYFLIQILWDGYNQQDDIFPGF